MSQITGKRSRTAWTTAALATAVAAGALTVAAPASAVVGDAAKDGQYAFTAKLDIGGGKRACTGALVDPIWVLTAASCFADASGNVTPGVPALKATVTVGRTDLGSTGGTVTEAAEVVPRTDRDLVAVRLAKPVAGVTPVQVSTAQPRQGEDLRVTGYGRTKDEWAPTRLNTAVFGADAVDAKTVGLAPKAPADASLCQGDMGGPVFRETNGAVELAGVATGSWKKGCWGGDDTETRTGAVATRVDDVNSWVQQLRLFNKLDQFTGVMTSGDFNGDGRADVAAVLRDGSLVAYYAGPDGTLEYGRDLWYDKSWDGKQQIIAGDFNGDGITDIAAVAPDGNLHLYAGKPDGKLASAKKMWTDTSWGKMTAIARYRGDGWQRDGLIAQWDDGSLFAYPSGADGVLTGKKTEMWRDKSWTKNFIVTGDFNGDGHDDIVAGSKDGGLALYAGNGKGSFDGARSMWRDKSWGTMQNVLAGDFDGDGKPDLLARWARTIVGPGKVYLYAGDGKGALADARSAWPRS
ncbi:FG-GAP-like repeat-containing protein [Streptomyces ehimensis]|uniref:FG-GAP-like repeat-containing protein n=1 Tax=Streptomyces ehimensis TaxID=68195 RepID=A0ABV9BLH1_9ACTN